MPLLDFVHEASAMGKHLWGVDLTDKDLSVKLFDSQVFDNSCTISAQMQILEKDFGMDLDEFRLAAFAAQQGFYDPVHGTDINAYGGAILKTLGYHVTENHNMDIQQIRQCVEAGKEVVVSVDANELYLSKPQEIQGTLGHSVRIVGYNGDSFSILDPAKGLINVDSSVLAQARDDYNNYTMVVDRPDTDRLAHIKELYQQKVMALKAEQIAEFKVQNASHILDSDSFDNGVREYGRNGGKGLVAGAIDVKTDIIEIGAELGNIFATGGFYSILEFLKDKPDMQKKVTKAALGLGALDAVVDVSSQGIDFDFEANPLLIASLGVFVIQKLSVSQNSKIQGVAKQFTYVAEKGCKAIEFAGYGALGIEVLKGLADCGLGGMLLDAFDLSDTFGALEVAGHVGDGVDMVEGLATLGLSIAVSRAVKFTFDKVNSKDRLEFERLKKKTAPKVALAKMLEMDAPIALITGLRQQTIQEES